ncbi:DNA-deoxyinosine glycosylase [Methanoregula sp.]|jgi:TDG/mug DNA glycosylase family protein|uniref:DNA-deoxyinosine glycosylase n=1 Tax=Methanoregula sp. TaxID=2052170 RepID=UPI002635A493|nr:DNA-deoxyinosine glycosylase [Methanoregula sp.]MDD5143391.1 DNA-deoxyinosine glycosylase [Methanoregula sp.]
MPGYGLPPLSSSRPRILILGSFPSVLSLERQEYYGNPKNRFWAIMEDLFSIPSSTPYPERTALLTVCGIALWDVVASCERPGSADNRIKNPVPNDIAGFIWEHPSVRMIALNGSTAGRLYHRFCEVPGLPSGVLPSTSPAYAAMPFREKVRAWGVLKKEM